MNLRVSEFGSRASRIADGDTGEMNRIAFRIILAALALFALIVALNRLDSKDLPDLYSDKDIPPSSLALDNGAYWLLFLGEPESEGLDIAAKIGTYREWLDRLKRVERLSWRIPPKTKPLGGRYWEDLRSLNFPSLPRFDWESFTRAEGGRLKSLRTRFSILVERFERMCASETIADFGYNREWDRPYTLYYFVTAVARFYSALQILDGEEGRWEEAPGRLLDELRLGERLVGASQSLFFYQLGRTIADVALEAMSGLINLPDCPDPIRRAVLEGLTPLSPERFTARNCLIGDYLWVKDRVKEGDRWLQSELAFKELFPGHGGEQFRTTVGILFSRQFGLNNYLSFREASFQMFLMKNQTLEYFRESLDWLLALDVSPPYLWTNIKEAPPSFKKMRFWWFINPSGKLLYESFDPVYEKRTIERKYRTRALYDLVRISAEMFLCRNEAEPSGIWLERLESFHSRDPFSGKPYRWDKEGEVLYSVGADGRDDSANPDVDLAIPVRISRNEKHGKSSGR